MTGKLAVRPSVTLCAVEKDLAVAYENRPDPKHKEFSFYHPNKSISSARIVVNISSGLIKST